MDDDGSKKAKELDGLFKTLTVSYLLKHQPDPKLYIAGDGWIKSGAGTLLIGHTGMGKSVLAEQVAMCVACGVPILGRIKVPRSRRVLYVQAENDEDTLAMNYRGIVKNLGLPEDRLEKNFITKWVFGASGSLFHDLLDAYVRIYKPELLVVDPYQSYVDGDINKAETFLSWIRPIEEILRVRGMGMLLVVHKPKPRDKDNEDVRMNVYEGAGTSAQANWVRTSCELASMPRESDRRFRLTFSKNCQRTGMRNERNGLVREMYVQHSEDPTSPFWEVSPFQGAKVVVDKKAMVKQFFLDRKQGASLRDCAEALGIGKTRVSEILKELGIVPKKEGK